MKKSQIILAGIVLLVHCGAAVPNETNELKGADEVLNLLAGDSESSSKETLNHAEALLRDIQHFRTSAVKSDTEISKKWIELARRSKNWNSVQQVEAASVIDEVTGKPVGFHSVVASLANPDTWNTLHQDVWKLQSNEKELFVPGLQFLTASLVNDFAGQSQAMEKLEAIAQLLPEEKSAVASKAINNLKGLVADANDNTQAVLEQVSYRINEPEEYQSSIDIPDVVSILGKDKAEEWLREALTQATVSIVIPVGEETRKLARTLAIQLVPGLKVAHWDLVTGLDSDVLFEAFDKISKNNAGNYSAYAPGIDQAKANYLVTLIVKNRIDAATAYAKKIVEEDRIRLSDETIKELESSGHATEVQAFLHQLLSSSPSLPIWDVYIEISAYTGRGRQAVDLIRSLIDEIKLSEELKSQLELSYIDALLAVDEVDEAVSNIIEKLERANPEDQSKFGLKLAELGRVLANPEWLQQGLSFTLESMNSTKGDLQSYWRNDQLQKILSLLRQLGRYSEAENLVVDNLQSNIEVIKGYGKNLGDQAEVYLVAYSRPAGLELLGIYHDSQNWEDLIGILEGFPYWGAEDLSDFYAVKDSREIPVGLYVAKALKELGNNAEALEILTSLLRTKSDFDPIYQLFLDVAGADPHPILDELYKIDQFEERPLIWKAKAILDAGDLNSAEKHIRDAIKIDPSDGDQGKDHRMRAYSVLADILEKKGSLSEAADYRLAVQSIRISEDADDFFQVGLFSRAISMYSDAEQLFSGAYCVQSRLAIQLTKQGRYREAEGHYRKAYRLMPESFGRVESHCFGCESVFDDHRAQPIAEAVFSELERETPEKAQIYYMRGYLKKEQGKYSEAIEFFRKAIWLDASYLNAWKQLYDASKKVRIEAWERDSAAMMLLELDPLGRHVKPDLSRVTALAELWKKSERAINLRARKPSSLYPLKASAQYLKSIDHKLSTSFSVLMSMIATQDEEGNKSTTPGAVVANTDIVSTVANLISPDGSSYY